MKRSVVHPTLKNATPGDLSFVIPYRHLMDIREMLQALDQISPGVNSKHTLLYGVEVKFYSTKLQLSDCLETKIRKSVYHRRWSWSNERTCSSLCFRCHCSKRNHQKRENSELAGDELETDRDIQTETWICLYLRSKRNELPNLFLKSNEY